MLASGFSPFSFVPFSGLSRFSFLLGLLIFAFSLRAYADDSSNQLNCADPQPPGSYCLRSRQGQVGYRFSYRDKILSVSALDQAQLMGDSPRSYRMPQAMSARFPQFEVVELADQRQLVVVSDAETSYALLFLTYPISERPESLSGDILLVLRGRLHSQERQLRLVKRKAQLYLEDSLLPNICGLASGQMRKLDLVKARFTKVRRSPLSVAMQQDAQLLTVDSLKRTQEVLWSALPKVSNLALRDGDILDPAMSSQSQIYLGGAELAQKPLRIFYHSKQAELFINTGKSLWRMPVEQGHSAIESGPVELSFSLPEGDCFSLISAKKAAEVTEIYVGHKTESKAADTLSESIHSYLRGEVGYEVLIPAAASVAQEFEKRWPTFNFQEREQVLEWVLNVHPKFGAPLLLKKLSQAKPQQLGSIFNWLKTNHSALKYWLKAAVKAPPAMRIQAFEMALKVNIEQSYQMIAKVIGKQSESVRKAFRSQVRGTLDRPFAKERYVDLAKNLAKQHLNSNQESQLAARRALVEWIRIGASAPELSNAEMFPLLKGLGSPKSFREAYVLLEGSVARISDMGAQEKESTHDALNLLDWADLKLSKMQRVALYDRLFEELISANLTRGRFIGGAASDAQSKADPIVFGGVAAARQGHASGRAFVEKIDAIAVESQKLGSAQLRRHVVQWWGDAQRRSELGKIIKLAKDDQWPEVRGEAYRALSYYSSEESFQPRLSILLDGLADDENAEVRRRAALGLARMPSAASEKALFEALEDDKSWEVKAAAVRSLGKLCADSAIEALTDYARRLSSSPLEAGEVKLALASMAALYRLNPPDLEKRIELIDLKKVPGPYQAGVRAARATSPLCSQPK